MRLPSVLVLLIAPFAGAQQDAAEARPHRLLTRWAAEVSQDLPWPEYPRPQLVRDEWSNLNGRWDYAIRAKDAPRPDEWDGEILVPFCVESTLSGVTRTVGPDQRLWYRRSFTAPASSDGRRVLLHFGAVDWECRVWVNGTEVGTHRGGYDAFFFDVADALREGANSIVVSVWDPTDAGFQPRGKQVRKPGGIWYTAVTGIWQTVWLESVPAAHIANLRFATDPALGTVRIDADVTSKDGLVVHARASAGGRPLATGHAPAGQPILLEIEGARPWSPDDPFLYDLELTLVAEGGAELDRVTSYIGLRSIELAKDDAGVLRLFLNGAPLFQYGLLDQGWWPDGLYTAPTDEALRYDLEVTRRLGFNLARKHVKVEPQRWYTWCDRLGILVWQDMPSGDAYIGDDAPDIERSAESARAYERELRAMIDGLQGHPSIVMWVPYNEGWGQWDTERIAALVREWDPTRLVNSASGWTDRGVGDVFDLHRYPGPAMPPLEETRAAVLGEFGGLGLPLPGHTWRDEGSWGYRSFATREELGAAYLALLGRLEPLVWRGLAAAVYTQTTDVEIEVNGALTYDRAVLKLPAESAAAARRLYAPPPRIRTLAPTSATSEVTWRYTTEAPTGPWTTPDYDDSTWSVGPGGFGEPSTPGSAVGTTWKTNDIWLRRELDLASTEGEIRLLLHHDEDVEVYLNGVLAVRLGGYVTSYELVPVAREAAASLHAGSNALAIHCHQTAGGQYVDAGLVELRAR
ncbi:MAG: beta-galactosidase [Planctomycetota bacterium]|nr:MAG: beta-galactosidase [Planctomycetota bacterium]